MPRGFHGRVGARREDPFLSPPQLRRGDELHRARDLLRRLDGADTPPDVAKGRHAGSAASGGLEAPGRDELGTDLWEQC